MNKANFSELNVSEIQEPENIHESQEELPFLEEIGVDYSMVMSKLRSTVLFSKNNSSDFINHPDMTGPLLLTTSLGVIMSLNRKLSFGFIYGYGFFGSFFLYFLLNMMLQQRLSLYNVISILGYCLMPVLVVSFMNLFFNMKNTIGIFIGVFCSILSTILVLKFLSSVS